MPKLGIMIPGVSGTLASTLVTGLWFLKHSPDETKKLGMLTEIPNASRLPLVDVEQIVIGGWDVKSSDPFETCCHDKVFSNADVLKVMEDTARPTRYEAIVTPSDYACTKEGTNPTNISSTKAIEQLRKDIQAFRRKEQLSEVVVINLSSPPRNMTIESWHHDPAEFSKRVALNDPSITSGMLYCLAAIREGCPYVDFTPSETLALRAIQNEAIECATPIAGKDGSTGQTLLKSVVAQMFEVRNLWIDGWYSTNLLGNHDGLVLSDVEFSKSKIRDKKSVLDEIQSRAPLHLVDIRYFPPKGDCKEAWDSIEFKGWLGEPMSLKVNWLGRDSVLAAPLILDLARLMEFSKRRGMVGIQSQFGVYFKCPLGTRERRFFQLLRDFQEFCEANLKLEGESI